MASLIYEISTHAYNKAKYLKSPGKDESGNPVEVVRITKKSERQYKDHAIKFGLWCKDNYKCRHFDDCKPHIQDYADFLIEKGYSASTIHTYLAAVCRVWNVAMDTIQKPVRHVAQNTRSRGTKASDSRKDAQREASRLCVTRRAPPPGISPPLRRQPGRGRVRPSVRLRQGQRR